MRLNPTRRRLLLGAATATGGALAGCLATGESNQPSDQRDEIETETLTLSSKQFTESILLSWMSHELFVANDQFERIETADLGETTTVENFTYSRYGTISHYWEYTGTLKRLHYAGYDLDDLDEIRTLGSEDDIAILEPGSFNNTYELLTSTDCRRVHGIETLSDFAAVVNEGVDLQVALGEEFVRRDDGWAGFTLEYGIDEERVHEFNERAVVVKAGDTYELLESGEADVVMGFSTDPELGTDEYVVLEDDRGFFPVYNPVPVVHQPLLDEVPEIADSLNSLSKRLDSVTTMRTLIENVTHQGESPQTVARDFVREDL
jgi:osmoprotectant transport system substrate-binding protein